jgi:hypothetical protein
MKRSPLVVLAAFAAVGSLCVACSSRDLNAGNGPDGGGNLDSGPGGSSGSGDGGATIIASLIQLPPYNLVSDGTSLFWVTATGTGGPVWSMPVLGGPITTVVPGMIGGGYLAVDDVNVYYWGADGLYRASKSGGGSPSLVNEAGATVIGATSLGNRGYWNELVTRTGPGPAGAGVFAVKSAPLQGGAVTLVAQFTTQSRQGNLIGVTATTVFLGMYGGPLSSFPLASGIPDGGMPIDVPGTEGTNFLVSDTDAVYCETGSSIVRVASDGTTTTLGMVVGNSAQANVAIDDTYVYWADSATVGTIMRVPKTGGTATIIARDTVPFAIAVDANAVYWADQAGNIMRLPK